MAKSDVEEEVSVRSGAAKLVSVSGRTTVTVQLNDEGDGTVVVRQDGHVWTSFDIPREQAGPNGEARNTN